MPSGNDDTFPAPAHPRQPVLLLTHDPVLWQRWQRLEQQPHWQIVRGERFDDLLAWHDCGERLVLLDADLPALPDWTLPVWLTLNDSLRLLVASTTPDNQLATSVVQAGCAGCLHAYSSSTTLNTALLAANEGSVWLGRDIVTQVLRAVDRHVPEGKHWASGLTSREKEIALRAAKGASNQAIADELGITERTVRAHLSAIFQKMQVNDRLMLALKVHGVN